MQEVKRRSKKIGIAIIGGLVLVVGIIAIPYPGPGWLIVFTGLAILATEFPWAKRVLSVARGTYDKWQRWLKLQKPVIRGLVVAFTCLVVILTLWLLNVYGLFDEMLGLNLPWLHSPLGVF
ncbi:MAG TPA: TIGR02611 family protein [Candidatus Saccharimonadales bacterium]|nr:TIGR02611 family protein [Candidatus Saccharimonadales bacterium]